MRSLLRILTYKGELSAPQGDAPLMPRDTQREPTLPEMETIEGMRPLLTEVTGDRMLGGRSIPLTPKPQTPKPLTTTREWLINKE